MEKEAFKIFLGNYNDNNFVPYKAVIIRDPLIINEIEQDYDRSNYNILEIEDIDKYPRLKFHINYVNREDEFTISDDVYEMPDLKDGKDETPSFELNEDENKKFSIRIKKIKAIFPKYEKFIDSVKKTGSKRDIAYKLNSRYDFLTFITNMNKKYKRVDNFDMDCKTMKEREFTLMNHQILVRNYINIKTPYRGLLVYHGLGAGKTCSSISVAEGIKDMNSGIKRQVCVLMPASLQKNFKEEIKLCGDPIYDKKYYKKAKIIPKDDKPLLKAFMNALGLSKDFIYNKKDGKERGKVWIPMNSLRDKDMSLSSQDKTEIENQINEMIKGRYDFINYNGNLEKSLTDRKEKNLFDHKLVIIDEVHNFISMIFNKIQGLGQHYEELGRSNSYKLYHKLLSAKNCKIIFLTGTPIINKPVELGILFNMLRGYIRKYTFHIKLKSGKKLNEALFKKELKKGNLDNTINYLNYKNNILDITRTPYGFIVKDYDKGGNVLNVLKSSQYKNENDFIINIIKQIQNVFKSYLSTNGRAVQIRKELGKDIKDYTALPDNLNDFNRLFLDINDENDAIVKNGIYFQKRINGLTSYYQSPAVELMPSINDFSDYNKDTSYPDITNIKIEEMEMSDYQFLQYINQRKLERQERKQVGKKNIHEKSNSTYKVYSRMLCNFVFPEKILKLNEKNRRPRPKDQKNMDIDGFFEQEYTNIENEYLKRGIVDGDKEHIKMLKQMINALKINKHDIEGDESGEMDINYLDDDNLKKYSPKFLRVYKNILDPDNYGANLVYSSFRSSEGIEIFSRGLEFRNFTMFQIQKERNHTGRAGRKTNWVLSEKTKDKLELIKNGELNLQLNPFYMIYSGTETEEKKELLRLIFNGDWGNISSNAIEIKNYLIENFSNYIDKDQVKFYSKFIKIFMISSSGAEGISLKNTRYVHILEPYWGPVRIDQVIGRARRICSHEDLPESKRNISVYLYLMKLSDKQKNWDEDDTEKVNEIVSFDKGKTSDQSMWELSQKKKNICNQFLELIKGTAVDCITNGGTNCKTYIPNSKNYIFGDPKLTDDQYIDEYEKLNQKGIKMIKFYINKNFYIKIKKDEKANVRNVDKSLNNKFVEGKIIYDKKYNEPKYKFESGEIKKI